MVIAAVSTVVAAVAFAVALLRDPPSDPADGADVQPVADEVAAARAQSDEAAATADAAMFIAEETAARAERMEEALAAALAAPGEEVAPDVIARIEAQLEEVRNLAAAALVAADTSPGAGDAPVAGDGTAGDGSATPEEEPAPDGEPAPGAGDASGEEPMPEDDGEEPAPGAGDASGEEPMAEEEEAVDLPGEPFEYGPNAGAALFVVGVPYGDILNVRHLPAGDIVATLDPVNLAGGRGPFVIVRDADGNTLAEPDLSAAVTATGLARQLPTTVWYQHQAAGVTGWSSAAYLAQLGATDDVTSQVLSALGGTVTDNTMAGLARRVADVMTSEEPPSRVAVSSAPVIGDLGEITVDVLGLPDDAVRGFRLHIFAHQDSDSDPFTLRTVERTTICDSRRGVSEDGLCN